MSNVASTVTASAADAVPSTPATVDAATSAFNNTGRRQYLRVSILPGSSLGHDRRTGRMIKRSVARTTVNQLQAKT